MPIMLPPAVAIRPIPPRLTVVVTLLAIAGCSAAPRGIDWRSQRKYGAYMASRGFWREALFRFQKAVDQKPDDARTQNDLAVAYESIGETTHALEAYKKALALAPGDAHIKRNYARFAEYYTSVQRASGLLAAAPGPTPGAAAAPVPPGATTAPPPAATPIPTPTATPGSGPTPGPAPVPTGVPAPTPAPTGIPIPAPAPSPSPTPAVGG
jgi:hypothetical protein